MPLGPFDWTGGPFLALYACLFVLALVAAISTPRRLRPQGRWQRLTDPDELAYLAGGPVRFVDTVVARLLTNGHMSLHDRRKLVARHPGQGRTAAEMRLLALPGPVGWGRIRSEIIDYAQPVRATLERKGVMMDAAEVLHLRLLATLPFAALLLFGAIKWQIGLARDKPVGILVIFLIVTLVCAGIRFAIVDQRTREGIATLEATRVQAERLQRAPMTEEMALAVALFGTTVFVGSSWAGYHELRRASGSDGSGGTDSSPGDGSCGGGGCGGCGGGGD